MFPPDAQGRRLDICRRPYKYHYSMLATKFACIQRAWHFRNELETGYSMLTKIL